MAVTVSDQLEIKKHVGYRMDSPCCINCKHYGIVREPGFYNRVCKLNNFRVDFASICNLYDRKERP